MNNVIARSLTLTTSYQPFVTRSVPLAASGIFYPAAGNTGAVYLEGDDGSAVAVPAAGFAVFGVDLTRQRFKADTAGDVVVFLGGTW